MYGTVARLRPKPGQEHGVLAYVEWANIHLRSACDVGLRLGSTGAGAVVARTRGDGAA